MIMSKEKMTGFFLFKFLSPESPVSDTASGLEQFPRGGGERKRLAHSLMCVLTGIFKGQHTARPQAAPGPS